MLAAVIANVNRGKSQRPYTEAQFMPKWDEKAKAEPAPEMDGQAMLRAVRQAHKRLGG